VAAPLSRSCGRQTTRFFLSSGLPRLTQCLLRLGPYYSWRSPAGGLADNEVPQCIHQARKLIYRSVTNYGDKDPGAEFDLDEMMCDELPVDPLPSSSSYNPSKDDNEIAWKNGINSFVVLAWTTSGTKKVRGANKIPSVILAS
jgi:hypothetical protein